MPPMSHDSLGEHRRHAVADDTVHDPAGLLGLHAGHIDGPGRLEGPLDLRLRDRVERHPLGIGRIDAEHLREVPGDGLSLAIQVGGEPDVLGPLGEPPELRDGLRLFTGDFVGGGEVVLEIDARHRLLRALWGLAWQVADMADRGLHDKALPQVLLDRFGLRGALHDDQFIVAGRGPAAAGIAAWLRCGCSLGGLLGHRRLRG